MFGNVLDFSGASDGFVRTVAEEGGVDQGFALLRIATADGADLCSVSYQPGVHTAAGLETDARQALVRMKGSQPRALYLGGGTLLKVGDATLRRSEEGLAYVEQTSSGEFIIGNPSASGATVTVKFGALKGLEAFKIDDEGKPDGKAGAAANGGGEIAVRLEAGSRIGLFPPGKTKS